MKTTQTVVIVLFTTLTFSCGKKNSKTNKALNSGADINVSGGIWDQLNSHTTQRPNGAFLTSQSLGSKGQIEIFDRGSFIDELMTNETLVAISIDDEDNCSGFQSLPLRIEGRKITIQGEFDGTDCLEQVEARKTVKNSLVKMFIEVICSTDQLSQFQGQTYGSINSKSLHQICYSQGGIFSAFSNLEIKMTFQIPDQNNNLITMEAHSQTVKNSPNGSHCHGIKVGNRTHLGVCDEFHTFFNSYDKKISRTSVQIRNLLKVDGVKNYQAGQAKFEINNWAGEMQFNKSPQEPRFNARSSSGETASGVFQFQEILN